MEELLKINRRNFIRTAGVAATTFALNFKAYDAFAAGDLVKLCILHTNDVHSRIEPFPMDGSRNQGLGGTARRAGLISSIRAKEKNVLLLDAGDIFQGTPYFNKFGGELEMKLMTAMGYDAATMGNHDFDNGLAGFHKQLPHANFPILCSNYDFSNTLLKGSTQPYKLFKKEGLKIGVFGIGIELKGLVEGKNYGDTVFIDPIAKANEMADLLKQDLKCDLIICLSHLGYKYAANKVSDQVLAKNNKNIDLIIGGHTHTFMDQPEDVQNLSGRITTINQVGFAGINLGRIDYYFERYKGKRIKTASPYIISNELDS
ncbi:bifunctional metallophosphatase/5'-nucleotidase [Pedobacter heparinus]|uniref:Metallophosphoesterase n=1 Tax=Pedobacter heparinus (strain ATCC 13125 / DSM 2366 / CIP 104194 / JCM 7457 / NBRC 12017 / NCIMB 9290 / NRRL B-14731 / HIM 762-3) TaxID=485917 RepID=C6XXX1_PEDHD|nr:metallophosphatase [Pedobacter heparinus]ACU04389.1 metallophosphoesterase [Pedobacter heparinus DSM 2366]